VATTLWTGVVFFKAKPTKEAYTSLAFWTIPVCTSLRAFMRI